MEIRIIKKQTAFSFITKDWYTESNTEIRCFSLLSAKKNTGLTKVKKSHYDAFSKSIRRR
jgi:hypothetical protein